MAFGAERILWRVLALAAVPLLVVFLPKALGDYYNFRFALVGIYFIAIIGLNVLTGYNGQISLGHGAFYAIGAYSAAILMDHFSWPYWATLTGFLEG